ncbi:MAG: M61 family metallopeptidase [Synechococcales bacterium]|nr:M61 family metallopeptidase [Synechococcales bacterium]
MTGVCRDGLAMGQLQEFKTQWSYRVAMPEPMRHLFEVTLSIIGWQRSQLELKFPVWTPGSYLVREYARHIQDFQVLTGNDPLTSHPLKSRKLAKNHWQIDTNGQAQITVSYRVYANELTVRTNHLDRTHGYFNGAALFFFIPGYEQQPIEVTIIPPQDWQVATALPAVDGKVQTYWAQNFDHLVDSPFEIGLHSRWEFDVLGIPHTWVVWGKGNLEPDRLLADTQKIIETEAALFGGLPYDRYLFLLHLTHNGFGGLEHRESCSLIYSRDGFRKPEQYERFLQLVAHEFFHLWNVKRIRPKALETFDYEAENYTPSLWFSEGTTSFYDLLIPFRAGIYHAKTYLRNLSQEITRYLTTPGRFVQPLSESSFDAWIKLYRPDANSANSQISYYLKGEMLTLLLDLAIRIKHGNQKSYDDVMRILWQQFGKPEVGFTPEELQTVLESVAGFDLSDFFARYLDGLEALPFDEYLAGFGLQLSSNQAECSPFLGLRVANEQGRAIVKFVEMDSPAQEAGLDAGDELVAIAGLRTGAEHLNDYLKNAQVGDFVEITYFHQDELCHSLVRLAEPRATQYTIVAMENPSERQHQNFQGWLGVSLEEWQGLA